MNPKLPDPVQEDLRQAHRLEWWTLTWMSSVVIVMWFVMGSSQAMKTALVEDILSLVPAVVFLVALRFERRRPNAAFPFGFDRVQSLSSLIAAVALCAVGAILIFDSTSSLLSQEHPTMLPVRVFGHDIWQGWLMIAGLVYSVIPPMILGRLKQPIAHRLQDEVLDTDAMMQKADWMTGLAGIIGIVGTGFGIWWMDAAAAAFISLSILKDGVTSLRVATAELVDGAPRRLGRVDLAKDSLKLHERLSELYPGSKVRLRATGRYIHAEVCGPLPHRAPTVQEVWRGNPERAWRLAQISFVPGSGSTS
ncbi:cation diffusion facilitator family transporter [Sphingobium vermicomposti]|uniref:Cation diffusion facilitator family transporter n=1 Tax=Sphingobium vermicomposti TaxID=529005 RepID=A0A846M855_9SPHN|nr:cation diffusion facilitator family transporter [Sphingobium vermicomposti]NIJ16284.1 cation diffusion facilitator family transporter [Sphingobium vermicomposti]